LLQAAGDVGASHGQDTHALDSTEALVEEDKVLLNCLEHVSSCEGLVSWLYDCCFGADVYFCTQTPALSKAMVAN
jgi:hypothetical protein